MPIIDTRNRRLGPWDSLMPIVDAINDLEGLNVTVKAVWFEEITSGTSGSFSEPTNGTIVLDEWAGGVDVLVSGIDSGVPNFKTILDTEGVVITGTLTTGGSWTISGVPADGYNISLIYVYSIAVANLDYTKVLETAQLEGINTLSLIGNLADELTGFTSDGFAAIQYSFVEGTRTATVEPSGTQASAWVNGTEFVITGPLTTVITDVEGFHMIYLDGDGALQSSQAVTSLIPGNAFVFGVYWNATANQQEGGNYEERHGVTMDGSTHQYLHTTRGAQWISGLGITTITADGDGTLDASAQIAMADGVIADEDILNQTSDSSQTLSLPAQIPVWYMDGAQGSWRKDVADDYPVKSFVGGSSYLAYNLDTAGTWSQSEVSNNNYILAHIFCTNDIVEPVIAIQGQAEYLTISGARAGALVEMTNLITIGLPAAEFVPLYTIIYEVKSTNTNEILARVRTTDLSEDYIDWRVQGLVAGTGGSGGTGTVVGPGSATDNAVARYDGATGALIQDSGVIVDDAGKITGPAGLDITGDITVTGTVDGIDIATDVAANTAARHDESHTVASHSDTTATGPELDELTDGSDTTLHDHDGISENTSARHAAAHTVASHSDTTATGPELDELTDGSDTVLHDHDGISENTSSRHAEAHTVASHSDTSATGPELDELTDGSDSVLHVHTTRLFTPSGLADHAAQGDRVSATVDANATGIGAALYMAADGNFEECDADAAATMPCRALALEAATGTKIILLKGFMRDDDWDWTIGGDIFVSTTTGALTQTVPAGSGDQVQIVGFAWSADIIYFAPGDYSVVEVA